jgi:Ca2+-binding RTX toxin-like protein
MTAYTFETITAAQAAGFTAGDTLTFTTPGATASQVVVVFTPASGGSGIPPSPIIPAKTTLTYNGISRDFPSASLAGYGGSTGQMNFPDGSMLYPGTSGADCVQGSGFGDGLYGDTGDDTFNGGNGDDVIYGFVGTDTITGGVGNDTIVLTGTSTTLNTAADAQIVTVEAVDASSTTAGVIITLSNQTTIAEGFSITGGSGADSITGGSGADSITGGSGNDTVYGFAGADTFIGGAGVPRRSDVVGAGAQMAVTGDQLFPAKASLLDGPSIVAQAPEHGFHRGQEAVGLVGR